MYTKVYIRIFIRNLLLKDPDMLTKVQVDTGATKYILGGADVMCPGLTSAGGNLPDGLLQGRPVVHVDILLAICLLLLFTYLKAIMAQGKESAMAVGVMQMSSAEMYQRGVIAMILTCSL